MKKNGKARTAVFQPADLIRRLLLLCFVLAVTAQAYLVQTHVHGQPAGSGVHAMAPAHPTPAPLDSATCQLCKEMLHAGVAITPAAAIVLVSLQWTAMAPAIAAMPATAGLRRVGWQGRAPPRR